MIMVNLISVLRSLVQKVTFTGVVCLVGVSLVYAEKGKMSPLAETTDASADDIKPCEVEDVTVLEELFHNEYEFSPLLAMAEYCCHCRHNGTLVCKPTKAGDCIQCQKGACDNCCRTLAGAIHTGAWKRCMENCCGGDYIVDTDRAGNPRARCLR